MNPGEGQGSRFFDGANEFGFAGEAGAPSAEMVVFIEEKIARRGAILNGEGGEGFVLPVKDEHLVEVDCAEDIDIVDEEWFV